MNPEARRVRLQELIDEYNDQTKHQKDQSYLKTLRGSLVTHAANEGIDLKEDKGIYSIA